MESFTNQSENSSSQGMVLATWRVSEYKDWMDGTEGTGILTRNSLSDPAELPSRQRPNWPYTTGNRKTVRMTVQEI